MNHFNEMANKWDTPEKVEKFKILANKIKTQLGSFSYQSVMDLGCGTGLLGLEFVDENISLLGLDTSEGMLHVFAQKTLDYPQIESLLLNLEEQTIDKKFDLIVSSMAFHHLTNPATMIRKLKGMLNKGGKLAIVDLDEEDGSFHPDPANMGVKHFGFSKNILEKWAQDNQFDLDHSIINTVEKNSRTYDQFLAIFS